MKVASKIDPCPVREAIMEVRFESTVDDGAVFGIIFNQLQKEYSKITNLPILEIPASIRKNDSNLIYLPYYRTEALSDNNKLIQIGPKVFSVVVRGYPGWEVFKKDIQNGLDKLFKSGVVKSISRFSLRYINFFEFNILPKTNLSIKINEDPLESTNTVMRFELQNDNNTLSILTMASHVQMKTELGEKNGSSIDIDTLINGPIGDFFSNGEEIMEKCHTIEKKLFFKILSEEYASTLKEVIYV
jgi:uncharacterized protein (TIGR04255 family)